MPQVYIRDDVYHGIIEIGIKKREEIRDFVNNAVSEIVKTNKKEPKDG